MSSISHLYMLWSRLLTLYRCKGMLKCPIRVKSKLLHTLQGQVMENEDLNSQEDGIEMNNLVITVEEGKEHNGSANTGTSIYICHFL